MTFRDPKPGERPRQARPPSQQERIKGSTQSSSLRAAMTRAMQTNQFGNLPGGPQVTSANYIGRDDEGRPMYRIAIRGDTGRLKYKTVTWNNGQFGVPQVVSRSGGKGVEVERGGAPPVGAPTSQMVELQRVKDKWLSWAATNLEGADLGTVKSLVNGWSASPEELDNKMMLWTRQAGASNAPPESQFDFGDLGGGGGGGGFAGPEYVKPDERVVEDFVKGALTSLVGTIPDQLVGGLVSTYMRDHRKDFDTPGQEIDPSQSVLEAIRNTEQYQEIHRLRPDSEDERTWISQRRQIANQSGLETGQEEFAIDQATVGGDAEDVAEAAAFEQLAVSGRVEGTQLEDRLAQTISSIYQGVVV